MAARQCHPDVAFRQSLTLFFLAMAFFIPYVIYSSLSPVDKVPSTADQSFAEGDVITADKYRKTLLTLKASLQNKGVHANYVPHIETSFDFKDILTQCRTFSDPIKYVSGMKKMSACDDGVDAEALKLMRRVFHNVSNAVVVHDDSVMYDGAFQAAVCKNMDKKPYARFRNSVVIDMIKSGVMSGPFLTKNYDRAIEAGVVYSAGLNNIGADERSLLQDHMQICAHAVFNRATAIEERRGSSDAITSCIKVVVVSLMSMGFLTWLSVNFGIQLHWLGCVSLPASLMFLIQHMPSMEQVYGFVQLPLAMVAFLVGLYGVYTLVLR
ncbi:hypothetical protein T484DRAFT_1757130 [Baffinella frigidus]|nr:hypothetical protein T484DRAFT_1757134 [Cryptophyta sp. CCMP2293]KAJ1465855.1 hypothetical protein T484DRAFT_1757130 [Cryptophyta sp. CCMP2293]